MRDGATRIEELENQLVIAKVLARRFWRALASRVDRASAVLFAESLSHEALTVVDSAFDAAEIVWNRQRILVEPVRRLLDAPSARIDHNWPVQDEAYLARLPNGETRNLTRAQLLMMAGMDADA
ncbi:hypothetical protein [Sphingomonas sp. CROZ-RG-20F-R02-07]|uniref:hypothetical protein n=1 Tax=Sphingomonas sp. CROZ-RG-20F-R02-07 TaxID=2914832 RepID=UPI001F56A085|nr:hypothetical protein [Sphingomonas sp. CROZ-RG-20F-R02-07]